MRIAVACEGLSIASSFVRASSMMCYTIAGGVPVGCNNVPAFSQTFGNLVDYLRTLEVDVLIANHIEDEIVSQLEENGISVAPNQSGDPLTAVRALLDKGYAK